MKGLSVDLKKRVRGFDLDVSWSIGNELAVLFGYSGAGKSLTLQMIAGLLTPDEGALRINGHVQYSSRDGVNVKPYRRPVGYVFQDLALFPHMTVLENILYGVKRSERRAMLPRLDEMVERFYLKGFVSKMPSDISGGQRQRVAFARALMRRPGVLLLDEPFSALDNPVRIEMRTMLRDLRREYDIPVVIVTHDLIEAYSLADGMIVYAGGKVAQAGSRGEIFHNPLSDEVERLVDIRNHFGGVGSALFGTDGPGLPVPGHVPGRTGA